jgi:hypothetical protein
MLPGCGKADGCMVDPFCSSWAGVIDGGSALGFRLDMYILSFEENAH